MKRLKLLFTMLLLTMSATVFAQKGTTMELWPNGAPNASSDEKDKAELTVYLPDEKKATGRAVVCCPGGGYTHLAIDHEGHQWAPFFNSQGGTAQASPAGSRQTNPAANIPASGRQRSAMPNTPFTRDRNRSTASGDSRVRDRRIPSDLSMREADISAAARKRQSEVIYGDALRTEVPMIQGTPSLYLRGTDGENRKVSVPFTNDLLSRHIMLLGGIGTGKTNAFFQMIDQLQHSLTDDDIMVIFDTKGDFYQEFFSPGDVVISNDKTSVGPNGLIRMYVLMCFFTVLLALLTAKELRSPSWKREIAIGLCIFSGLFPQRRGPIKTLLPILIPAHQQTFGK